MSLALDLVTRQDVTMLSDTDSLVVMTPSGVNPISFTNLLKSIQSKKEYRKVVELTPNVWLRIACVQSTLAFSAIINVHHAWLSGTPVPLIFIVTGTGGTNVTCQAERLTQGEYFYTNQSSFTKVRFVKEGSYIYVEVQFRNSGSAGVVNTAISCEIGITLISPEISTANETDVLETINLMMRPNSGGYNYLLLNRFYFNSEWRGRRAA